MNKETNREMYKEISTEHRVGLAFGDWLTGCNLFLVEWDIYRDRNVI